MCQILPAMAAVLIETLWNVKQSRSRITRLASRVLIETLWNVKCNNLSEGQRFIVVLIETLWNVKVKEDAMFPTPPSINRNIVECKDGSHGQGAASHEVLIETLWNVKEEREL